MTDQPEDERMTMIRACLTLCARRLRTYERQHRAKLDGPLSMVEHQEATKDAEADGALADMAEGLFRTSKQSESVVGTPSYR